MARKITIKEIAEKANVSSGTVDRVLHNRGEVSEKTREKILAIVRDGNYEPNIFARNLVLNKTYTIAALLPEHHPDDYWAGPAKGIQQAARELKALGIQNNFYLFREEDPGAFEKMAGQVLRSNPDGILLSPVIYEKALYLAGLCAERNIPLVIIDSDIPDVKKLSFIGQNAFQSGHLAAKLLNFGGGSNTVYLATITKSTDNNDILKQRKKGFASYYKGLPGKVKINPVELHEEDKNFKKALKGFVQTLQPFDNVFVPNSKVHYIAQTLNYLHKPATIRLVGYDLIPKNIAYLNTDTIDFLINQKPEVQGYQGLQLLYKHLVLKQEVPSKVFMPLEIVTRENVDYINY